MKYDTQPAFDRDFSALPPEHRKAFREVILDHLLPAIAAGAFTGTPPWPRRLRIHQLVGTDIYSITWSFKSPDGRATFHIEVIDNEPHIVWRRIGTHAIYNNP